MQDISVNKAVLIGRLEKDPELRYTSNNTAICSLRVLTTESYANREGQPVERRVTHTVVIWGQKGERLNDQLRANSRVFVEGSIRNRSYENNAGERKWVTEIIAQTAVPLDAGGTPPVQQGAQGGYTQTQPNPSYSSAPVQQGVQGGYTQTQPNLPPPSAPVKPPPEPPSQRPPETTPPNLAPGSDSQDDLPF